MAVLKLVVAPDPRLEKKALPVERVDAAVGQLMDDMLETMYATRGVGLAAPQVGVSLRVITVDVADTEKGEKPAPMQLANPEIIWASDETAICQEGCLSLPDFYEEVERPAKVKIKALNRQGKEIELAAEGLLAVCLQHEIDHLNGKIFVDHISRTKRDIIIRKLQKNKKLHSYDKDVYDLR
jgi:peptide deformylase